MTTSNLTKREIVSHIYGRTSLAQKDIQVMVQECLDCIQDALAEGRPVELRNFGVFELQVRKARVGRNPNRPERDVPIPERVVVKFKAGKIMRAKVSKLDPKKVAATSRRRPAGSDDEDEG